MIFSYEVGVMKPEKQIYQELIKESRSEPGQILYFDDDSDNVTAARKLGIQSFVCQNFENLEKKLNDLDVI